MLNQQRLRELQRKKSVGSVTMTHGKMYDHAELQPKASIATSSMAGTLNHKPKRQKRIKFID